MKVYESNHIKNIALLGHAGSGKTTLAETMLFEAGVLKRRGTVEDHNTISDYHDIEHERGNSIFGSLIHLAWKESKINIIDTPGFDDFTGEVFAALKVVETGVLVLNAQYGLEVGSEIIWDNAKQLKKPMILAVNQVDSEKSDFDKTVDQAKSRFGDAVTILNYPYNQGEGFNAIIDVLRMVMYKFPADGGRPDKLDIPDEEKERADALHNELVEKIAEHDETLMELFFEKGTLDEEEMQKGLKLSLAEREIFPIFCMTAKQNMGSGRMMGFINNVCPTALEMEPVLLTNGETLKPDSNGEPVIFVYKTISEAHLGDMSYFKVFSGTMKSGSDYYNLQTNTSERINQIFLMEGKKRDTIDMLHAGDIGATVKLKNTHTNNTLAVKGSDKVIQPIQFPDSRIRVAVAAIDKSNEEKLSQALHSYHEEDPTIIYEHSKELKQTIINAQGELQLAILKWKIEHHYKFEIDYFKPRIPYRETIQKAVKTSYRHKKQSGGAGQFGEVYMLVEPFHENMPDPPDLNVRKTMERDLEWGGKLVFNNCIVGGAIDAKFMPSIMKGIMEKMYDGPLTGSYVRDVRVSVYDGKMHAVDSNDMAFKLAGMMAFKNAFQDADPKILEPIYNVEVLVPDDMMGDVMSDLQTRRAVIQGIDAEGHYQKIKAKVPLIELYKYSSALRSITQGRAKHIRSFSEYSPVPFDLQKELISNHKEESTEH